MSFIISGHVTVLRRVAVPPSISSMTSQQKELQVEALQSSNLFWPNTTEQESTEFPKQVIIHTVMPNNGSSRGLEAFINVQPSFFGEL